MTLASRRGLCLSHEDGAAPNTVIQGGPYPGSGIIIRIAPKNSSPNNHPSRKSNQNHRPQLLAILLSVYGDYVGTD